MIRCPILNNDSLDKTFFFNLADVNFVVCYFILFYFFFFFALKRLNKEIIDSLFFIMGTAHEHTL